jgi:alpha,alpha-trehalase
LKQEETQERGEIAYQKVVFLPNNNLMNRYLDNENASMVEKPFTVKSTKDFYKNLRASNESEWIEGKRWSSDSNVDRATDILPVDLNALLYFMEVTLSEVYKAKGKEDYSKSFAKLAQKRKAIFNQYFWNDKQGFYYDFDFVNKKQREMSTLGAVFPLLVGLADQKQADRVAEKLEKEFLKNGGLLNELNGSGIGTAEFQFFAIESLQKNEKLDLAKKIKERWLKTNLEYFAKFGKIEESYNVAQPLILQKNSHQNRIEGSLSVLLVLLKK